MKLEKKLNETARRLLQSGEVQVVIGYEEGFIDKVRPVLISTGEDAERLLYDVRCTQNLALYLHKKEIVRLGKPAIVANFHTLRGIIRLAAEKQISDENLIAIVFTSSENIREFRFLEEIERYLSEVSPQLLSTNETLLRQLNAMTVSERWNFWQKEMKNCIRCYACRQACPLCYCAQCTAEINQPQWIPVPATPLGNTEWHIMRAMHLAGRCVECGSCGQVCPSHIPIHLLPIRLAQEIKILYGSVNGTNRKELCAMSTYQTDDTENFIK